MRVEEIMTRQVESVSAEESAGNALQKMRARRIRHLVAIRGGEVVGVISDRDLESLGTLRQVQTVGEVMTSPVVAASPEMTLRKAANLLRGRTIGCLPVMDRGKLVGILTITDLLDLIGQGAERSVSKRKRRIGKSGEPSRRRPRS